jgi:hypothetical protein
MIIAVPIHFLNWKPIAVGATLRDILNAFRIEGGFHGCGY